jgi:benzoyl-CoA-dihydrodiol lyase
VFAHLQDALMAYDAPNAAHDQAPHAPVTFRTQPDRYRHWSLKVEGPIATLTLAVDKDAPLKPGYELKLNSYDLGVDIELADAVRRLRFEHPGVRCVVVTSSVPKMFCAGANIKMLASSTHTFKVNFCKFTNETRCEIEEATAHSHQRYVAAVNGTAAGGGYELAEACAEIYLIDDGFSAVSLPEVPLLGVLPGTGGLTRLVDKRKVRRDHADVFCTKAEGFRLRDALKMRLVDGGWPKSKWDAALQQRVQQIASEGQSAGEQGIALTPVERTQAREGAVETLTYRYVTVRIEHGARQAHVTVKGPDEAPATTAAELRAQGSKAWALQAFRELDDALLDLRFNFNQVGLLILRTQGDAAQVLAHDAALTRLRCEGDWLARETQLHQARVLRRLDNMARSMFALVEPGSCYAGTLLELAWAADRAYMLDDPDGKNHLHVGEVSFGALPMHHGLTRLQTRFLGEPAQVVAAHARLGQAIDAQAADTLGLVTRAPDDIDWDDEVRLAIEERVSYSPDALTGMEQNLRFPGPETCDTKVFGRLSAWQNWIFQRPNAVGARGALSMYGNPQSPVFDFTRT